MTRIVVEHRDRLTRFGIHDLQTRLQAQGARRKAQGRQVEVVSLAENENEKEKADLIANPDCRSGGD